MSCARAAASEGQLIIPAESLYAAFEAKQTVNAKLIEYAQKKIATARSLHRTSLPIPHAGGFYDPKIPGHIGHRLSENLCSNALSVEADMRLDLNCVTRHGIVTYNAHAR